MIKIKTCFNCNNTFPQTIKIDGKIKNLNNRKYCFDCAPYKTHNTKTLENKSADLTIKKCYICQIEKPIAKFHQSKSKNGRRSSECKDCVESRVAEIRKKHKKILVDEKGGKCEICGYAKCIEVLCFHHLDPNEKSFQISTKLGSKIETLLKETAKCMLLCTNCHGEMHDAEELAKLEDFTHNLN